MKIVYKWLYPALIILLLIVMVGMMMNNREQSDDLKAEGALETYEKKNRPTNSGWITSERAAGKDRQHGLSLSGQCRSQNRKQASLQHGGGAIFAQYFKSAVLFGKDFDTRWSSEFDARLEDWLRRYMDAVMFEDKEGHRRLFDSESMQEEDPFWRDRGKLTGFLMAATRAEQAKAEIGIGGDLHAVELFALTKNYDVIAATLYIHRSGGHELIVRIEQ